MTSSANYHHEKARGMCPGCSGRTSKWDRSRGHTYCQSCRNRKMAHYQKLKARGVCPRCGGPQTSWRVVCVECVAVQKLKETG